MNKEEYQILLHLYVFVLLGTHKITDSADIHCIFQIVILKTATFSSNAKDSGLDKAPAGRTEIVKSLGWGCDGARPVI
jgi:hypothetical protein